MVRPEKAEAIVSTISCNRAISVKYHSRSVSTYGAFFSRPLRMIGPQKLNELLGAGEAAFRMLERVVLRNVLIIRTTISRIVLPRIAILDVSR